MATSNPELTCCGRRHALRLAGATLAASLLHGTSAVAAPAAAAATPVKLPAVTLLDGTRYQPETGRGTGLIVVFWSVTCPFCRNDNPHVDQLHRSMANKPLKLLTASIDQDPAPVRSYMQEKGFGFPVTLDSAPLRAALSARKVIPLTCCIDRAGALRDVIVGEMFEEDILGLIKYAG
ncbi:MAG: TlpA disulfide reductase family protein [Burkholderiaceae bacterium]